MPSLDLTPIFEALRQAARLCRIVQQQHVVRSEKAGHEPVTIADYGSQAILCRAIQQLYPDDAVMSEENGRQFIDLLSDEQRAVICDLIGHVIGTPVTEAQVTDWLDFGKGRETARMWVIDPIDGTKGFLAERHYVNAVGVLVDRQPVTGLLAAPAYPGSYRGGALLHAIDGAAYIESLADSSDRRRIHVSQRTQVNTLRALESVEKGHSGLARLARVRQIVGMDDRLVDQADSMEKYGRVAAGDAEVYMRLPRKGSTRPHNIWDHAPGAAIVTAAGGRITDVDGSPLDYSSGTSLNNYGVIASNGAQHDAIIQGVQQLLREEEAQEAAE
ncbi:MAG: inositol monophosphatase family protein [Chloroflexota bacterium]